MEERRKLTKKYFMSLPEGLYLVSNVFPENSMQPQFAEKVAPLNLRSNQWERITEVNVHQRLCNIFENEKEYKKWLSAVNYNISKNKRKIAH